MLFTDSKKQELSELKKTLQEERTRLWKMRREAIEVIARRERERFEREKDYVVRGYQHYHYIVICPILKCDFLLFSKIFC